MQMTDDEIRECWHRGRKHRRTLVIVEICALITVVIMTRLLFWRCTALDALALTAAWAILTLCKFTKKSKLRKEFKRKFLSKER